MKINYGTFIFLAILSFWGVSCSSVRTTTYLKDISNDTSSNSALYTTGITIPTATFNPLIIQPDDIVSVTISVLAPSDPNNPNVSTVVDLTPLTGGGTVSAMEGTMINNQNGMMNQGNGQGGFLVDKEGNINVPVIGTVHVQGLTTDEVKDIVSKKAEVLYKNPVVNVTLANFKIGGLGLLGSPGVRIMSGERITILDAIAAFGDIQVMGRKDNIMIIRHLPDNQKEIGRLNLNSSDIMRSPYFYLRPGDIIYVEPRKAYAATPDLTRQSQILSYVSVLTMITSAVITIIALTHN